MYAQTIVEVINPACVIITYFLLCSIAICPTQPRYTAEESSQTLTFANTFRRIAASRACMLLNVIRRATASTAQRMRLIVTFTETGRTFRLKQRNFIKCFNSGSPSPIFVP